MTSQSLAETLTLNWRLHPQFTLTCDLPPGVALSDILDAFRDSLCVNTTCFQSRLSSLGIDEEISPETFDYRLLWEVVFADTVTDPRSLIQLIAEDKYVTDCVWHPGNQGTSPPN